MSAKNRIIDEAVAEGQKVLEDKEHLVDELWQWCVNKNWPLHDIGWAAACVAGRTAGLIGYAGGPEHVHRGCNILMGALEASAMEAGEERALGPVQ